MWSSWFGGFAEPSDYATAEMPPVNIRVLLVVAAFAVPYLAFLLILPGVRKKRVVTWVVVSVTLCVGFSIVAGIFYPAWTVGDCKTVSQFRAHTNERMLARLGVKVGLQKLNVTLRYERQVFQDTERVEPEVNVSKLYYNEMFDISGVSTMADALRAAYYHGLPYPILSVLEYFSLNQDAFDWGRHYRNAGYYTMCSLWLSFSFWVLAIVLLLFLPHFYGRALVLCGLSSLVSSLLYLILSPTQLRISFLGMHGERVFMDLKFGWCFFLVFSAGLLAVVSGLLLMVLQHFRLYSLSTFLDSSLDETVTKRRRKLLPDTPRRMANSIETMQGVKPSKEQLASDSALPSSQSTSPRPETEEVKASSSGFQSRSSYAGSFRSQSSFESVANLERSPSSLTLNDFPPMMGKRQRHLALSVDALPR